MNRALGILLVLMAVIAAGCEFEAPLTEKQGLPLDARLLGTWANVNDKNKNTFFKVSTYSETEYQFSDHNGDSFSGYPGKLGNTSFIQMTVPDKSGVKKYFVISYVFLGDELQLSILDTPSGDKSKALVEIRRSLLQNRLSGGKFTAAGNFKKENITTNAGENPSDSDEKLADLLMFAADIGDLTNVKRLIARGAKVNFENEFGITALGVASANGHLLVVRELLAKGANPNLFSFDAFPLTSAAASGHTSVVEALLARGAKIDAKDSNGETALMRGAANGHVSVVRVLLAKGAQVSMKDESGLTALDKAKLMGHDDIVQILKAKMKPR